MCVYCHESYTVQCNVQVMYFSVGTLVCSYITLYMSMIGTVNDH